MKLLVCVLLVTLAYVQAKVGEFCTTEAECDAGECCQILSQFMVVSKRQLHPIDFAVRNNGSCQLYKIEDQACSSFEKINGYCGCGPGLQCHMYEVPIEDSSVGKRSMIAPRPGYTWRSECWTTARIAAATVTPQP